MAKYSIEDTTLTNIANAIREKTGSSNSILVKNMAEEISGIETNTASTVTQATPSITVSSSGLITASATQTAGLVAAGTKSSTKQLSTQAAKTVTPTTSEQTAVASGRYTTGAVKVAGDSNLKAENIAEGVSIFGVTGTMKSSEDLTSVLDAQETKLNALVTSLEGKAAGGGGVETCTVEITVDKMVNMDIVYTSFENNTFCCKSYSAGDIEQEIAGLTEPTAKYTLTNVVCNSAITCSCSGNAEIDGTAELYSPSYLYDWYAIKAPSVSGETCAITIT